MKKTSLFTCSLLAATICCQANFSALAAPAPVTQTEAAQNKVEVQAAQKSASNLLSGKDWLSSSTEVKTSVLSGIAMATEQGALRSQGKKYAPTKFETAWSNSFEGVPVLTIAERIDAWYAKNPTMLALPVMDVVWKNLIKDDARKTQAASSQSTSALYTGETWKASSLDAKTCTLFGVKIAAEQNIMRSGQGLDYQPSIFERAWIRSFKGVPITSIVEQIDSWYAKNPSKASMPVMDALWNHIIKDENKR